MSFNIIEKTNIYKMINSLIVDGYEEDYDPYSADTYYDNYCFRYTFYKWYFLYRKYKLHYYYDYGLNKNKYHLTPIPLLVGSDHW
jgi:hypothetical protein